MGAQVVKMLAKRFYTCLLAKLPKRAQHLAVKTAEYTLSKLAEVKIAVLVPNKAEYAMQALAVIDCIQAMGDSVIHQVFESCCNLLK